MSSFLKRDPSAASAISSSGSSLKMSGGTMSSSGLIAWQTLLTSWLNASYASASRGEWRAISLRFSPWSCVSSR